ncbi:hypothetical protein ACN38_g3543 [Penicillium nordicum]|uniref:Uncharacterized protein n=1 Tax=Penicillium nordicum TaxID=229535 RepID=A0A0M9WI15_9EURO|nr:hypothetical protein ACN38_g3543 [Penicillium nordicum]
MNIKTNDCFSRIRTHCCFGSSMLSKMSDKIAITECQVTLTSTCAHHPVFSSLPSSEERLAKGDVLRPVISFKSTYYLRYVGFASL